MRYFINNFFINISSFLESRLPYLGEYVLLFNMKKRTLRILNLCNVLLLVFHLVKDLITNIKEFKDIKSMIKYDHYGNKALSICLCSLCDANFYIAFPKPFCTI